MHSYPQAIVVRFTPRPLYSEGKKTGDSESLKDSLEIAAKKIFVPYQKPNPVLPG